MPKKVKTKVRTKPGRAVRTTNKAKAKTSKPKSSAKKNGGLEKIKALSAALGESESLRARWLIDRDGVLAEFHITAADIRAFRKLGGIKPFILSPWPPMWDESIVVSNCAPSPQPRGSLELTIDGAGFEQGHEFMLVGNTYKNGKAVRLRGTVTSLTATQIKGTVHVDRADTYDVAVGTDVGTVKPWGRLQGGLKVT